jgi:hypothetical protein
MAVSSDLGQAGTVLEAGTLACSGPYVIEQVELDADEGGGTFRRLVFIQSQGVIQTEVKLVAAAAAGGSEAARKQTKRKGKGKRKGSKKTTSTSSANTAASVDDDEQGDAPTLCEDFSYLCFDYHKCMIAGAALGGLLHTSSASSNSSKKATATAAAGVPTALLIGLGGGALPMALRRFYPKLAVAVCELDPQMLDLATRWFGFREGPALRVAVGDGLMYARQCLEQLQTATTATSTAATATAATANGAVRDAPSAAESQNGTTAAVAVAVAGVNGSSSGAASSSEDGADTAATTAAAADDAADDAAAVPAAPFAAIFIDVDSKDASVGMSCPPAAFAEESYLRVLHSLLQEQGVLAINVAARSAQLHAGVLAAVTAVFCNTTSNSSSSSTDSASSSIGGEVHQLRASDEDVNTVVLALKGRRHASAPPLTTVVRDVVAAAGATKEAFDMIDMVDLLDTSV